jgi:hypothetical protein
MEVRLPDTTLTSTSIPRIYLDLVDLVDLVELVSLGGSNTAQDAP